MLTQYTRVLPRDAFNEAKLLKGIGRLTLKIHDGQCPEGLQFKHYTTGLKILQENSDGSLVVQGVEFSAKDQIFKVSSRYNSKDNYTLYAEFDPEEVLIFDEEGEFTSEFIFACEG